MKLIWADVLNKEEAEELLPKVFALEEAGYPADESATFEKLQMRLYNAGDLFLLCFEHDFLVGYITGTASAGNTLEHQSMSEHVKDGNLCCIHSVVVEENHRRTGIASNLLREYIDHISQMEQFSLIALISKKEVLPLYEKVGFKVIGLSKVVHGSDPWYECHYNTKAKK
jgi:ribosomal protein S18 acetylase RimI-like enzyme